jgi:hypothetical protein
LGLSPEIAGHPKTDRQRATRWHLVCQKKPDDLVDVPLNDLGPSERWRRRNVNVTGISIAYLKGHLEEIAFCETLSIKF